MPASYGSRSSCGLKPRSGGQSDSDFTYRQRAASNSQSVSGSAVSDAISGSVIEPCKSPLMDWYLSEILNRTELISGSLLRIFFCSDRLSRDARATSAATKTGEFPPRSKRSRQAGASRRRRTVRGYKEPYSRGLL